MTSKKIKITNKSGLHVQPSGELIKAILPFGCEIVMKFNEKEYNVKSILGIMSAGVKCGDEVEFTCIGVDEKEAMETIEKSIAGGLGE